MAAIPKPTSKAPTAPSGIVSFEPVVGSVATGVAVGDPEGSTAGGAAEATRSVDNNAVARSTPPNAVGLTPLAWATISRVASGPGAYAPAVFTYA